MLKVKRDDFYELNNDDNDFNMDNVNDLFKQISNNYNKSEEEEEDKDDGGKED